MLQSIHDNAKGWIAYMIVGLITIPFALFGINQYFSNGGSIVAAVVNDEEIPAQEINKQLLEIKQRFGGQLPPGFNDELLKKMALNSVVDRILMKQIVEDQGYRASNQEIFDNIKDIEIFQENKQFSLAKYEQFLKSQRRNKQVFEEQLRNDIATQQFTSAISITAFLPQANLTHYQQLIQQKRDIETFTLSVADYIPQITLTEKQIQDHYKQNKANFKTEDKIKVAYVEINVEDLAKNVTVNEKDLKDVYDQNMPRYVVAEQRKVNHIVFKDKKQAQAIYDKLKAGELIFAEAAKTHSIDPTSSGNGGELGFVVRDEWKDNPEFAKTVFELPLNTLSKPVKTNTGYEIIQVTEIKAKKQKTFVEVKAAVETSYRKEEAEKMFIEMTEKAQTLVFENEGSLEPAAQAIDLKVKTSDWLTRQGGKGIGLQAKVRTAAFSDDVLVQGRNSELLELSPSHAVAIRLLEHQKPQQKDLQIVKADIEKILKQQQAKKLVKEKGDTLLKQIKTKQAWTVLTELALGTEDKVIKAGLITRNDKKVSQDILLKAFAMSAQQGKVTYSQLNSSAGDYTIIALKKIDRSQKNLKIDKTNAVSGQLGFSLGQRESQAVLKVKKETAEIELFPKNL